MMYRIEATNVAARYGLDPFLVLGQVQVESNGNAWAWNPEPSYRYLWNVKTNKPFRPLNAGEMTSKYPPKDFPCLAGDPDQEWWAQQASWGLMQIMGALAREKGFRGPFLTELCDPTVNLTIGCAHLADLLVWARGNPEQALAAYNGGKGGNEVAPFRSQAYADRVLAARAECKVAGVPAPLGGSNAGTGGG